MQTTKRILVADDDPAIVDCIQLILEDEGYDVETTLDGALVGKLIEKKPHVLLLDIWMSGYDGRDICKKLKANNSTKGIPVILISANKDTEKISMEAGADDFIGKPFEIDELLEKVKKYSSLN